MGFLFLQSPADLGFCELSNESFYLCRLQAMTCIFRFVYLHCVRKGKSHITPQLMFVLGWWDIPSEANANFEYWSSCFLGLFGFGGSEQGATLPDAPASLTGIWAAQVISKTKPNTSSPITSRSALKGIRINHSFSAFKIRVHLEPMGFATWIFKLMGCLCSERNNHQGVMDGGWPLQQITAGWEMRGRCEWLISQDLL